MVWKSFLWSCHNAVDVILNNAFCLLYFTMGIDCLTLWINGLCFTSSTARAGCKRFKCTHTGTLCVCGYLNKNVGTRCHSATSGCHLVGHWLSNAVSRVWSPVSACRIAMVSEQCVFSKVSGTYLVWVSSTNTWPHIASKDRAYRQVHPCNKLRVLCGPWCL